MSRSNAFVLVLVVSLASTLAHAQALVPPIISFSGFLTDAAEEPVTETASVMFKLYEDDSDGDACTLSDECDGAGNCFGVLMVCDDANECTVDICNGGACQYFLLDNGTACTGGTCQSGNCTP